MISLVVNHTPWIPERVSALEHMRFQLTLGLDGLALGDWDDDTERYPVIGPWMLNDTDYRGTEWQQSKVKWALDQWHRALDTKASHHLFMTDDLYIAPQFWNVLNAMLLAQPDKAIGLLSNHPQGPELVAKGIHWYRCNSWIVGPAYVLPRALLERFVAWFEKLPDGPHTVEGTKAYRNDDSSLNEWITRHGPGESWHPLPTIVEHRRDLASVVGHGDQFSHERVSWREMRAYVAGNGWTDWTCAFDLDAMTNPEWWKTDAPMLGVGG